MNANTNMITPRLARFQRMGTLALAVLALVGANACAARTVGQGDGDAPIASQAEALSRGGGGSKGAGFTCTNGECTCSKEIENDCEDMSGVCSDDTVDDLIRCIQGWLTTDCTCRLAVKTSTPVLISKLPTVGTKLTVSH